jgi:hypothetical protein
MAGSDGIWADIVHLNCIQHKRHDGDDAALGEVQLPAG